MIHEIGSKQANMSRTAYSRVCNQKFFVSIFTGDEKRKPRGLPCTLAS